MFSIIITCIEFAWSTRVFPQLSITIITVFMTATSSVESTNKGVNLRELHLNSSAAALSEGKHACKCHSDDVPSTVENDFAKSSFPILLMIGSKDWSLPKQQRAARCSANVLSNARSDVGRAGALHATCAHLVSLHSLFAPGASAVMDDEQSYFLSFWMSHICSGALNWFDIFVHKRIASRWDFLRTKCGLMLSASIF